MKTLGSSKPMRLTSIQALRGIAALTVTMLHFARLQQDESIRANLDWQSFGWIGVDLFFIISGFIMIWVTANVAGGKKTAGQFLAMRVIRIYPLWFVCMILVGIFFYIGNDIPASIYEVSKEEAWPFFFRSFFLIPQDRLPLISLGWTLIHEMFFYLIFTVFLAMGLRKRISIGIILWAVVTAVGLHLGWREISPAFHVIFSPMSFLFMAGMATALIIMRQEKPALAMPALLTGIVIFAALFFMDFNLHKHRVISLTIPFSLILYGCVSLEKNTGRTMPKFLTWLGDISYSVYLLHALVIIGWRTFLKPFYKGGILHERFPPNVAIILDSICLIAATIITAAIFYYVVEQPSLKFFRSKLPSYRAKKAS